MFLYSEDVKIKNNLLPIQNNLVNLVKSSVWTLCSARLITIKIYLTFFIIICIVY